MSRVSRREQDERALRMLEMRRSMRTPQIAVALGIAQQGVASICRAVVLADVEHGDPSASPDEWHTAYPWHFKRKPAK